MPRLSYVIVRENEQGEPDESGLPVIRNAEGEVLSSPYDAEPKTEPTPASKTASPKATPTPSTPNPS